MSQRQALRAQFRALRQALPPNTQQQHAHAVVRALLAAPPLQKATCIAAYLADDGEVDLASLLIELTRRGQRVALPRVGPGQTMTFHEYLGPAALTTNRFGIAEPAADAPHIAADEIELLLLPLVAFDSQLTRLGRGGGYYDRYLSSYSTSARPTLIGVAHCCQRSEELLPREPWDVPLDLVVTERDWHRPE